MARSSPVLQFPAQGIILGSSDYREPQHSVPSAIRPHPRVAIVADVRLDNRDELCRALDLTHTVSDDDLLAAAWMQWDFAMVDHLIGGFAFACWDAERQALFLARDHAGERPLHFTRSGGPATGFAFASLPQALCALPHVGHVVDVAYMAQCLAVATPQTSQTAFRGVERLMPAHWIKVTPGGVEVRRYWHPMDARPILYRRDADYIEDFRDRFDRAVGARLAVDAGLASTLSGGLDSSSVTATAARLLAAEGRRLASFTSVPVAGYSGVAMPGRFGDEGPAAADVAAMYPNIDHVRVDASGRSMVDAMNRAARRTGEPAFNPTNQLWMDAIRDGVRCRGVDVLLEGAGGNSTISFGGISGLPDLFRKGRWIALARQVRTLRSKGHTSWRGALSWATGGIMPEWIRRLSHPEMREFSFAFSPVHPDRAIEYGLKEKVLDLFYGTEKSSAAVRRQAYEYYDPGVINAAAAAEWQIELRDPTQDKRVYEFCFAIPIEQYLIGGQSRSIIRRAMEGRLPASTLQRTTRGLQAADWHLVMGAQREQLAAELRRVERSPMVRHLIDTARLHTLLDTWPAHASGDPKANESWHLALSRGIAAGSFLALHDPDFIAESGTNAQ